MILGMVSTHIVMIGIISGILRRMQHAYARQYCNGKLSIVELEIDVQSFTTSFIDLDHPHVMKQWEHIRRLVEERANKRWKKYSPGKAKKRHNLDGIILEVAIQENMFYFKSGEVINPDFLVKNTYTSFIPHTISNFPNGRKLVIRNLSCIHSVKEKR